MKTIQPALSAIGVENHASVSVVISDTDQPKEITNSLESLSKTTTKEDPPPKMAHPSTTSPPIAMIHS